MADKNYKKAIDSFLKKKAFGEFMSPWSVSVKKRVVTLWQYDARISTFNGNILTICPESLNREAINCVRDIINKSWNAIGDPWWIHCYKEGFYLKQFLFLYPLILDVRRKKILSQPRLGAILGQLIKVRRQRWYLNTLLAYLKDIIEYFGLPGFTDAMLKEIVEKIAINKLYIAAQLNKAHDFLDFWDMLPEGKGKFLSRVYEGILCFLTWREANGSLNALKTLLEISAGLSAPQDLIDGINEKMVVLCMTQVPKK